MLWLSFYNFSGYNNIFFKTHLMLNLNFPALFLFVTEGTLVLCTTSSDTTTTNNNSSHRIRTSVGTRCAAGSSPRPWRQQLRLCVSGRHVQGPDVHSSHLSNPPSMSHTGTGVVLIDILKSRKLWNNCDNYTLKCFRIFSP